MTEDADRSRGEALVFALAHEIGNLIAVIRLEAHLIDEDLSPVDLARATVAIDDHVARVSALLAQTRPLLTGPSPGVAETEARAVLTAVDGALAGLGAGAVKLSVSQDEDLGAVAMHGEWLHHLLLCAVFSGVEAAKPRGEVHTSAFQRDGFVVFEVSDSAEVDDEVATWPEQELRGRPLVCAIADHVLRKCGGRLAVSHGRDGGNTLELWAPAG